MRKLILAALIACSAPASAGPALPDKAPPPQLVVVLAVDQLSSDLFEQYRPHFTGGLARLSRGTVFRNGYQAHAATETCPGHATIITGAHPAKHGIIGNLWYNQGLARGDKRVFCAENPHAEGSSSTDYHLSAVNLMVPTLGDMLKDSSPDSKVVVVAGKDRAAMMFGGIRPDQRWFWDSGQYATDLQQTAVPRAVAAANATAAAEIASEREGMVPPPLCAAKSRPVTVEGTEQQVGTGQFARAAGDAAAFRVSPELDRSILHLAAGLARELELGKDSAPDLLAVSLSATDLVGHSYGTGGMEMCLQLLSLDRDLGDFFQALDNSGINYAVMLTADHGGDDLPERLRETGMSAAARVDPALAASTVGAIIGEKLRLHGPVLLGEYIGDMYINSKLDSGDRANVLREALLIYRGHPQVEAAFSAEELRSIAIPAGPPDNWTLAERARASFHPDRSGDLVVLLKPHITPVRAGRRLVATHGSVWDYDRRVPILFWKPGMPTSDRDEPISTVSIVPTVAPWLGLAPAEHSDGICLAAIGVACPSP
jgi:predicted AlkP superfamily pyrophosphatase or phosphodiesterase